MMTAIDDDARLLWDYLHMQQQPKRAAAIFVLCSIDTRVAERAAALFNAGYGAYIIISGGLGRLSKDLYSEAEAHVFAKIMMAMGVPNDRIIIEDKSTNTGENIRFTYELLQQRGLHFDSLLLVQKPYMERRTYATFKKQWPDQDTVITVTSPTISYDNYYNEICPKDLVLNLMVGDVQRIKEYAKLGFQIEQAVPDNVWAAFERLVAAGYTKHLIPDKI
jgi:uncharacterized SAM-binding protein YcdF (DUF218 family)